MKRVVFGLMALVFLLSGSNLAMADVIISHQGDSDPTIENFGLWPFNGGIVFAPIADDGGQAAWQIANTGPFDRQAVYSQKGGTGSFYGDGSGLTQAQIDDINSGGFVMSLRARIVEGPTYDPNGSQEVSAAVALAGFHPFLRFDIALANDGEGNTVVILPRVISFDGTTFSYAPFGSPLLLTGTDYHLYQLSYDPVSETAALFVDGVLQVTGYPGSSVSGGATANNFGLAFGSVNDATANFALARLDSGQL